MDTTGKHGPFDQTEGSEIVTMALECLTVLCNQSIKLDVFDEEVQNAASDVPRPSSGSVISSILMDHIAALGANIPLVLNLFRVMLQSYYGRESIRKGIVALCTKAQDVQIPDPTTEQIVTAAQWLASQYRALKLHTNDENMKLVFDNLESILRQACITMDQDLDFIEDELPPPAPVRFAKMAIRASRVSAESTKGSPLTGRGYHLSPNSSNLLSDSDCVKLFWSNHSARQIPLSSSTASIALSKYSRWNVSGPLSTFCVAGMFHPWLTHPTRPLNESMRIGDDILDSTLEMEEEKQKEEDNHTVAAPEQSADIQPSQKDEREIGRDAEPAIQFKLPEIPDIKPYEDGGEPNQVVGEDEGLDLYADLVPALDEPNAEEEAQDEYGSDGEAQREIKQENIDVQPTIPEEDVEKMEIRFDEESQESEEVTADSKEQVPDSQTQASGLAEGDVKQIQKEELESETAKDTNLSNVEDIKALLGDKEKIAELLRKNPALLTALKQKISKG